MKPTPTARLVAEARFTSSNPAVSPGVPRGPPSTSTQRETPAARPQSKMAAAVRPLPQRAQSGPHGRALRRRPRAALRARRAGAGAVPQPAAAARAHRKLCGRRPVAARNFGSRRRRSQEPRPRSRRSLRSRHVALRRALVKPPTDPAQSQRRRSSSNGDLNTTKDDIELPAH